MGIGAYTNTYTSIGTTLTSSQKKKKKSKEVYQYAIEKDPSRCFVQLYKLYNSKCPETRPSNAFYLTPLANPKQDVWYSRTPIHSVNSRVK